MKFITLILSLSFGLFACASTPRSTPSAVNQFEMGQPIDPAKVDPIIEGKTTEQEAIALLGATQTIQERPDGSKILIFNHYQTQMGGPSFSSAQQQPMKSFTGWTYTPPNQ